jgi:hypothetical protein
MSEPEKEPFDAKTARVLGAGRGLLPEPGGAKGRVRARLAAALPGGDPPAGEGSGSAGAASGADATRRGGLGARVPLWTVGVAALLGGAVGYLARSPETRFVTSDVQTAPIAPPVTATAAAIATPAATTPIPSIDVALLPTAAPAAPAAHARGADLAAERAILDVARTALARGDGAGSLAAAQDHARKFPRGALAEEREAIAVQALVLSGDVPAARQRAERFRRAFPGSLLLPAVAAAVPSDAAP